MSDAGKDLPINNSNYHHQHDRNSSVTSTPPDQQPNSLQFQPQLSNQQENGTTSALTINLPSSIRQFNNEENDEPTTPTSSDQKIPVTTTCPPAPRKPKAVPMGSNKLKTRNFQRISVDLRVMMDALFDPVGIVTVPDILTGDLGAGDHAKKVKKANVTTG